MRKLLINLVWANLRALGLFEPGEHVTASLREQSNILPIYERWLQEWVRIFLQEGYLTEIEDRIIVQAGLQASVKELQTQWAKEKEIWSANQYLRAQIFLLDKVMQKLEDILIGNIRSTEVIFPDSSLELVEAVYKHNPMTDHFNHVITDKIADYITLRKAQGSGSKIRILEIGAGTGATTALLLNKLLPLQDIIEEYCYSDVSNVFLNHAEKVYGPGNPFLSYRLLNVEEPLVAQGLDISSFDIVIAANALHATKNIHVTLKHAKSALKKNGLLFLNEIAINSLFCHMTFGLLEGWWLYEDPEIRIPGCPGLYSDAWRNALENVGFHSIVFPCKGEKGLELQIIIAESDGVVQLLKEKTPDEQSNAATVVVNTERTQQADTGKIESILIEELAVLLRIDKDRIDVNEPFSSYGLDSILAVNYTRLVNEKLKIDMDITVMFEYATTGQLCDYIVLTFEVQLEKLLQKGRSNESQAGSRVSDQDLPELAVEKSQQLPDELTHTAPCDDVAIIGLDGRFPGARSAEEFWQVIESGKRCINKVPQQREDWQSYTNTTLSKVFNLNDMWGGFLDGVHDFDPLFFHIAPTEAEQMTPEQRLMLMCVWNTIEDAGYTPSSLSQQPTGVFIAVGPSEYQQNQMSSETVDTAGLLSTQSASVMPNRISYHFNFHGPSESCDTTCSSSLVSLHRALRSLQQGECKQAIVGGVNLVLSPMGFINMNAVGMLSRSGEVYPFQNRAEGTTRSEGVGAILIKPLQQAIIDNDNIYAVIKGTGVAHGGKGVSLTAPNIKGMKTAIRQAYSSAAIDPYSVSYIEAHGMASTLADSAEIAALKSSFSISSKDEHIENSKTYISCLKPCIGHAEIASGMAALFKVVFAMQHKVIPGIVGFTQLNDAISLEGSPLDIACENTPWEALIDGSGSTLPRRAGINSFGVGGINAYVIIEESPYANEASNVHLGEPSTQIIVLSARDEDQLRERVQHMIEYIQSTSLSKDFMRIAYTLQFGREAMEARLALVVNSLDELSDQLEVYLSSDRGVPVREELTNSFYFGDVEQRSSEIAGICAGEAGEVLIKSLLLQGNLAEIAHFWSKGADISWSLIYENQNVTKISLPGYPFKRISYSQRTLSAQSLEEVAAIPTQNETTKLNDSRIIQAREYIADLVSSGLGISSTEIKDNTPLQNYGLNSLLLINILNQIKNVYSTFDPAWMNPNTTLQDICGHLTNMFNSDTEVNQDELTQLASVSTTYPELLHLNTFKQGQPIFWIHGALGSVEAYQSIAENIQRPFYAIQARGFMTDHTPIEGIPAMAAYYIEIIQSVQKRGPYDIGGFCLGGIIAYEITRQLQQNGQSVNSLVMIDSPDATTFKGAADSINIPIKNAALQVVNMLLWNPGATKQDEISVRMIHQDELDPSLDDVEFIKLLGLLAIEHGLAMRHDAIIALIKQNVAVQTAYKLIEYEIKPLPMSDGTISHYFRNRDGLFFGELEPYLQLPGDTFSLDCVNYWQDWQRELDNITITDVDASNHMTIMSDHTSVSTLCNTCRNLYLDKEMNICI